MEIKVIGFSHFTSKKNGKQYTNVYYLCNFTKAGEGSFGKNVIIPHMPELQVGDTLKLNYAINTNNNTAFIVSVEVVD